MKDHEEVYSRKVYELGEEHQRALRFMQIDHEEKLREARREAAGLLKGKEELQLALALEQRKLEAREREMRESYGLLEEMYGNLNAKLSSNEKNCEGVYKEKEGYYLARIRQLEGEVEHAKAEAHRYVEDNQKKSEEALEVLKNYSDMEKQAWEKRVEEEREKGNRKARSIKEDYERKMLEEKQGFEEAIGELEERVAQTEKHSA